MRVAAINDLSGFGKCSLLADISIMSALGIEVCPVPTAIYSGQTGFSSYYMHDTGDLVKRFKEEWEKMDACFDGILTGYLPHKQSADYVIDFVKSFKRKDTLLLVDPVMGDGGKYYSNFSNGMLSRIKKLTYDADIITPNLTELCILAGINPNQLINDADKKDKLRNILDIVEKIRISSHQSIIVTGIQTNKNELSNLVISQSNTEIIPCKYNGLSYSGTGDTFAALLLGYLFNGNTIYEAVSNATEFISNATSVTKSVDRNYGIDFEKILVKNQGGTKV
ncbi:bifunctional hydroxymethylpyrimidine kinase/phosphomethylpyrimidine kinase [Butyrivibrio sp. AE3004]|uniref:bifunctional hydroxymethylpyrimidine kinase/phosphomethylpyrimidine kinase n=1 Tax=Butyrivibrio sp. AE3004 TaxID=1506994 RepID=UPI000494A1A8|nr:bifunctional hydroxymethylpyrimidine kinase/phosphomethylpyrimidine kinase [Butyrivibrio sp. AE3004]